MKSLTLGTDKPAPASARGDAAWSAWQQKDHATAFDARSRLSLRALRHAFESFNETQLFLAHKPRIRGRRLTEIGCATGEFYRYLRRFHPGVGYGGFDISAPAIDRARAKYPDGAFALCRPDLQDLDPETAGGAIVWSRDVAHHQPKPYEFLRKVMRLSDEATVLRLRTRDRGATVFDPEQSCQWHYGEWVPYIVMNLNEVLDVIREDPRVRRIDVVKQYATLGGREGRFLPKDCYDPETGTAETAVLVSYGDPAKTPPEIVTASRLDTMRRPPMWRLALGAIRARVKSSP